MMTVKKQLKKKDMRVTAINGSEIVKRKKNTNDSSVRNRHYCGKAVLRMHGPEQEIYKLEQLIEHLNLRPIDLKELRELTIHAALKSRLF